jgi:hypothetical protein
MLTLPTGGTVTWACKIPLAVPLQQRAEHVDVKQIFDTTVLHMHAVSRGQRIVGGRCWLEGHSRLVACLHYSHLKLVEQ